MKPISLIAVCVPHPNEELDRYAKLDSFSTDIKRKSMTGQKIRLMSLIELTFGNMD